MKGLIRVITDGPATILLTLLLLAALVLIFTDVFVFL
jgi:hypothetical protein